MKSPEEFKQRVRRETQLKERLRVAATRLEEADRERVWSIAMAHDAGLSIRKIAEATGLSSSRVHQILQREEAAETPQWLSRLSEPGEEAENDQPSAASDKSASAPEAWQQRVADEIEVLRWCIDWLEQLDQGRPVVVNLRADQDSKTAYAPFDQARVRQVLKRVAGDLDELSGRRKPSLTDPSRDKNEAGIARRRRLAELEPQLSSLSQREQRAILREMMDLPPSHEPRC